jgi:hypothetical protein
MNDDVKDRIREFPAQERRVESGAIRFGDDWAGLFLRGDDCMAVAMAIGVVEHLVSGMPDATASVQAMLSPLRRLRRLIDEDVMHPIAQDAASCGPQRGPASVAQIEAQRKASCWCGRIEGRMCRDGHVPNR